LLLIDKDLSLAAIQAANGCAAQAVGNAGTDYIGDALFVQRVAVARADCMHQLVHDGCDVGGVADDSSALVASADGDTVNNRVAVGGGLLAGGAVGARGVGGSGATDAGVAHFNGHALGTGCGQESGSFRVTGNRRQAAVQLGVAAYV